MVTRESRNRINQGTTIACFPGPRKGPPLLCFADSALGQEREAKLNLFHEVVGDLVKILVLPQPAVKLFLEELIDDPLILLVLSPEFSSQAVAVPSRDSADFRDALRKQSVGRIEINRCVLVLGAV